MSVFDKFCKFYIKYKLDKILSNFFYFPIDKYFIYMLYF